MATSDVPVPFDLKHFEQITTSEMNWMASVQSLITDFNIGSINRTMLEAVAMEMEELYLRLFTAIEKTIPIAVFRAFDFTLRPATASQGIVTFSRSTPAPATVLIPAGTLVSTSDGLDFKTILDVTIAIDTTTIDTSVQAIIVGQSGNIIAGAITLLTNSVVGVETVTNALAISGGQDEESEDSLKTRFQEFIASLARTPTNGIAAGGKTAKVLDPDNDAILEQVVLDVLVEPYLTDTSQPAGVGILYIDNGTGAASASLVAACQKIIDGYTDPVTGDDVIGYRSAGVVIRVLPVVPVLTPVTATITARSNFTLAEVEANVRIVIDTVFGDLGIGETLDWEKLLSAIFTTLGVQTVEQAVPVVDVAVNVEERIIPGTITLTVNH